MRGIIWGLIAHIASKPAVANWLISRSKRTPYSPITSRDGADLYMDRHWLFNPYTQDANGNAGPARWSWLPSIRVHQILSADDDVHMHDHPWNARTIVLRGWYTEERPYDGRATDQPIRMRQDGSMREEFLRRQGYTGRVLFGQYHRISRVPPGDGVFTLWFTWKYRGTWGFLVEGKKVPWRIYLGGGR